jgi:hypothetical protein
VAGNSEQRWTTERREEQSGVRRAREGRKVEEELLLCPCTRIMPQAHLGRRSLAATGTGFTTTWWARSLVVAGQMVCVGGTR